MCRNTVVVAFSLLALLLPSACGGGGGGGGPPPAPKSPLLSSSGILDFGEVSLGQSGSIAFTVTNPTKTDLTISSVTLPASDFTLTGPARPFTIPAGGGVDFDLEYLPTSIGRVSAPLKFSHSNPAGTLSIPVRATTGGQVVTNYGVVALDGQGRTPWLTVDVPADAISLTVEGLSPVESDEIGLEDLTGPGGRLYTQNGSGGDYTWQAGTEVFSTTVPNTDRSSLDLVAGGGTYSFRLMLVSGVATTLTVRAIVERRPGGDTKKAVMDLNVWFTPGLPVDAASAGSSSRMQAILSSLSTIYSQQGISVGEVAYYDVSDANYSYLTEASLPDLMRVSARAAAVRVNLFFVQEVYGRGVVGASSAISGPDRNGTGESGVAVVYGGGLSGATVGAVVAHEIGHLLGLYHTVESNGQHDIINDTLNCPATGTSSLCPVEGGGYLMNWEFLGGTTITNGEGKVMRAHPLLRPTAEPAGGVEGTLSLPLPALEPLPDGWCGTR